MKARQLPDLVNDLVLTLSGFRFDLSSCSFLLSLGSRDHIKDLRSFIVVKLAKTTINDSKSLHDLSVLSSGLLITAHISLLLRVEVRRDGIELFVQISLQIAKTNVNGSLDHTQIAFPTSICIIFAFEFLADDKQEWSVVVGLIQVVDESCIVAHDGALSLQSIGLLRFHHLTVGITHQGNKHVQKCNLSEERGAKEENVAKVHLWPLPKIVDRELSQRKHVLVVQCVQQPNCSKSFFDDWVFVSAIQLQDVHGSAKHEESDNEDDEEVTDVVDCFRNQPDEERCLGK